MRSLRHGIVQSAFGNRPTGLCTGVRPQSGLWQPLSFGGGRKEGREKKNEVVVKDGKRLGPLPFTSGQWL